MYGRATPSGPRTAGWFNITTSIATEVALCGSGDVFQTPPESRSLGSASGRRFAFIATAEAVDTTLRVHHALLARVKRVTSRADIDLQLGLGGASRKLVAAGARDRDFVVFRVDAVFHHVLQGLLGCPGQVLGCAKRTRNLACVACAFKQPPSNFRRIGEPRLDERPDRLSRACRFWSLIFNYIK